MNLRELIIGRILFAVDEEFLIKNHGLTDEDLDSLSDLDLFELFEEVIFEDVT